MSSQANGAAAADVRSYVSALQFKDEDVLAWIDQLDVSADAKALLHSLSRASMRIGRTVLKIGRKLVDLLFSLVREFPALSFGAIFGLLVGALVSAIPLIGAALGPIVTPLAVLLGVLLTFPRELADGDLGARVRAILEKLAPVGV